ncbi:MAG TPA: T9SS type A sorting domain-containing protein [Bacteroidetes bacterium]|nr:T9SS type A sorting domain-containing protein [Bacteroidota bacterium]
MLRFGAGSGLELEVTYHNSGADTVTYGVPGQGEVMRLHAWVWSDQPTAVRTETPLPVQAALLPNYPNPFNPETRIVFTLPAADHVLLTVHDISGRLVARLVDGARDAGRHALQWNAIDQPSGVYFVRLQTGRGFSQSRKLILLK